MEFEKLLGAIDVLMMATPNAIPQTDNHERSNYGIGRQTYCQWLRVSQLIIRSTPLPTAVVDNVLHLAKERDWSWATVSSSLATAASAFRSLLLYTGERFPVSTVLGAPVQLRTAAQYCKAMLA